MAVIATNSTLSIFTSPPTYRLTTEKPALKSHKSEARECTANWSSYQSASTEASGNGILVYCQAIPNTSYTGNPAHTTGLASR